MPPTALRFGCPGYPPQNGKHSTNLPDPQIYPDSTSMTDKMLYNKHIRCIHITRPILHAVLAIVNVLFQALAMYFEDKVLSVCIDRKTVPYPQLNHESPENQAMALTSRD